jgi:hypothetical protein
MENRWADGETPTLLGNHALLWVTQNPAHLPPPYFFREKKKFGCSAQNICKKRLTTSSSQCVHMYIRANPTGEILRNCVLGICTKFRRPIPISVNTGQNRHMAWPAYLYDLSRSLISVTESNSILCVVRADAKDQVLIIRTACIQCEVLDEAEERDDHQTSRMLYRTCWELTFKSYRLQISLFMTSRLWLIFNIFLR